MQGLSLDLETAWMAKIGNCKVRTLESRRPIFQGRPLTLDYNYKHLCIHWNKTIKI